MTFYVCATCLLTLIIFCFEILSPSIWQHEHQDLYFPLRIESDGLTSCQSTFYSCCSSYSLKCYHLVHARKTRTHGLPDQEESDGLTSCQSTFYSCCSSYFLKYYRLVHVRKILMPLFRSLWLKYSVSISKWQYVLYFKLHIWIETTKSKVHHKSHIPSRHYLMVQN